MALPNIQEGSGGPGDVGSLSWRVGRGCESLSEGREGSKGPSRGLGGVGRPSKKAVKGQEALPEGWEGSGVTEEVGSPPEGPRGLGSLPGGLGGVGRPS